MTGQTLTGRSTAISKGDIFEVLRNRRRRFVLHYLKRFGGPVSLSDLATQVAAWEHNRDVEQVTSDERRRVYTTLQQTHLEKMASVGIIDYDATEGVVSRTPYTDELTVYLEVVPDDEFPWREYYLSLGAISSALVVALWTGIYPFTLLSDLTWASLIAVTFTFSAVYHTYTGEEMKIEQQDVPPEVPADD
ncbi:hypothetical protein VB773_07520 [Haloarculaceae archaeon H-GB2-1]|nr:hypothetical protein [Haloarculaceae archaeon H-GB1-1]MEA5385921.1 hypothetical protein [Haloarculaceae archaeon H-GB11]MEA5407428.1 hypothetical protein [Haloarculaceae archaeon H-GB2-1]